LESAYIVIRRREINVLFFSQTSRKGLFMAKKKKVAKKRKAGNSGLTKLMYDLSPELAAIVGTKKSTRPQVVKKLWVYIKAHKCQDSKNRRLINPDKKLSEVLGKKSVDMLKMAGLLSKHIKK
jgi:chromatin remodeling complex protein RSC6